MFHNKTTLLYYNINIYQKFDQFIFYIYIILYKHILSIIMRTLQHHFKFDSNNSLSNFTQKNSNGLTPLMFLFIQPEALSKSQWEHLITNSDLQQTDRMGNTAIFYFLTGSNNGFPYSNLDSKQISYLFEYSKLESIHLFSILSKEDKTFFNLLKNKTALDKTMLIKSFLSLPFDDMKNFLEEDFLFLTTNIDKKKLDIPERMKLKILTDLFNEDTSPKSKNRII